MLPKFNAGLFRNIAPCVFGHRLLLFRRMSYIGTAKCSGATKQSKKTNSIMKGLV